jgi:aryl-alcohol dehydrogenase-like predicted oxidoreductase
VSFGTEIDEESSYRVMDHALESGITFFDTAEAYDGAHSQRWRKRAFGVDDRREATMESSERIVGRWMQITGCRDYITLSTKLNPNTESGGTGPGAENVHRGVAGSLERLGTDHMEVYLMHSPDRDTPIAETLAALTDEARSGRIELLGGSNYTTTEFREALDASASNSYSRFDVCQPAYSLIEPDDEEEMFPLCHSEGIAVTPYSPLGAGFLTGKYTRDRTQIPKGTRFDIKPSHVDVYFNEKNFRIVDRLRAKAAETGLPMVRLAMAWAMTNPLVTSTLVGARTTDHIDNVPWRRSRWGWTRTYGQRCPPGQADSGTRSPGLAYLRLGL